VSCSEKVLGQAGQELDQAVSVRSGALQEAATLSQVKSECWIVRKVVRVI